MQWIILIGDENLNLETFEKMEYPDSVDAGRVEGTGDRMVVEYESGYVFFDYVPEVIDDYEEDRLEELFQKVSFKTPHFVMLTYSSEKILEKVLNQENFPNNLYVDDDYGTIMEIEKFVVMLSG
jgi:hypothetical protein